jgi:hypothetical protein
MSDYKSALQFQEQRLGARLSYFFSNYFTPYEDKHGAQAERKYSGILSGGKE